MTQKEQQLSDLNHPLVIKPYLGRLSKSEFFTVLVGGVASIAGSMLLAYANFGVKIEYLIAASFMSAPAEIRPFFYDYTIKEI